MPPGDLLAELVGSGELPGDETSCAYCFRRARKPPSSESGEA